MNKNWYAVYTKTLSERKTSQILSKKKIENFCPLNSIVKESYNRKRIFHEPLFPSFVFVNILESEMLSVKGSADVINFVYWLGKPAIIKNAEIENISHFINSYYNLKVEKTFVNPDGVVHISNEEDSNPQLKNIKVSLPSLGYVIKAETKKILPDFLKQNESVSKIFA